ncbi:MAG: hypothetical protein WB797_03925 [Nocardioides sp.]
MSDDLNSSAWRDAAADLAIDVTAPYEPEGDGQPVVARVAGFGSSQGTIVVGRSSAGEGIRDIASSRGMHCSEIDEATYSRYDRDLFVETLNDWGWYGEPSAAPEWYTGKPWG